MNRAHHIDVGSAQAAHHCYYCSGDVFLTHRVQEEHRVVSILSDGLGSGAIANVLATLTASMALRFTIRKQEVEYTARTIMNTLPMDARKQLSYSTFIIADVEKNGRANIIEFDNPPVLLVRAGRAEPLTHEVQEVHTSEGHARRMRVSHIQMQADDRLVMVSDGVTQSGMGRLSTPFGYGVENLSHLLATVVREEPGISSQALAEAVVQQARIKDLLKPKDDITCGVVHFREPRRLIVCTGPPYSDSRDVQMAERLRDFKGRKIVAGGTTSQIVSRIWGVECTVVLGARTEGLPPTSKMAGVDLVTEGIITLTQVAKILQRGTPGMATGPGPAWAIVGMLLSSDTIEFVVGTRINVANYDPDLPIELEARRTIVRQIEHLLKNQYAKEVTVEYI